MSTLLHSLMFTKAKKVFLILDQSAIFLLIAGTYTPIMLIVVKGIFGISLLSLVWFAAITGIKLTAIFREKLKLLTLTLYVLLGWIGIIAIKYIWLDNITLFILLVLGGVLYTAGLLFFFSKKIPFGHTV